MLASQSMPCVADVEVGEWPGIGADDHIRVRLLPLLNSGWVPNGRQLLSSIWVAFG